MMETKYYNMPVAERNRKIYAFFATPISQVNKPFFKKELSANLD